MITAFLHCYVLRLYETKHAHKYFIMWLSYKNLYNEIFDQDEWWRLLTTLFVQISDKIYLYIVNNSGHIKSRLETNFFMINYYDSMERNQTCLLQYCKDWESS